MSRHKIELTNQQIKQLYGLAKIGANIEEICLSLGICQRTFYTILARNPEVRAEYDRGKAESFTSIRRTLYLLLEEKNPQVAIHLSKSKLNNIEKKQIELTNEKSLEELEEALINMGWTPPGQDNSDEPEAPERLPEASEDDSTRPGE